ncbi:MAG: ATP-binding protein [Bacteroidales bacterium]|nr:ATP-binding protein [Bacteroidales bacterium]
MTADLRTKKFLTNVISSAQGNVVKTAALYGANNTGKTCFIQAIRSYRAVIQNKKNNIEPNLFTNSTIVKLGAVFLSNNIRYHYRFSYDQVAEQFIEEDFAKLEIDTYGNELKTAYFYRNTKDKTAISSSTELSEAIKFSSKSNILINTLEASNISLLNEAKSVLLDFAKSIVVISLSRLSPYKTISILKDRNSCEAMQIVDLIKYSDLEIEDFSYQEELPDNISLTVEGYKDKDSGVEFEKTIELFKLVSTHRGTPLPSLIYDSLGTQKIIALAGYVVDVLSNGGTLLVDEFDSGIHFKLSRAIVSLFNSSLNDKAQLIFSTHDISLLDIKTLLRKEQIWFSHKDSERVYLYSLKEFTAQNSGLRQNMDLYERYSKGVFGAIPDPHLIDALINNKDGHCNE